MPNSRLRAKKNQLFPMNKAVSRNSYFLKKEKEKDKATNAIIHGKKIKAFFAVLKKHHIHTCQLESLCSIFHFILDNRLLYDNKDHKTGIM